MSLPSIQIGASGGILEQAEFRDILRGRTYVTIYEGNQTYINGIIATLQFWERMEISNAEAPKLRMTVYAPDLAESPWFEILANLHEESMYSAPEYAAVTQDEIAAIQAWIAKPVTGSDPMVSGSPLSSLATELFNLIKRGATKYPVWDHVMRYSVSVSNQIALTYTLANSRKTHTKEQMAASIPGGIPAGTWDEILTIENVSPPSGFSWGWLKIPASTRQTQLGRVVVSGEWWLSLWPTRLFPPV